MQYDLAECIPLVAAPAATSLVRVNGLFKTYRLGKTEVPALRGVDLEVYAGELLAISGPSGSGKTTLLNMIGLIDRPNKGEVWLGQRDVLELASSELARLRNEHIGFVFQSFNLVPVLSAFENVLLPLQIRGSVKPSDRHNVKTLLAEVGLADHMKKRPDILSGGQRQRVALARALVTKPEIVIADEPTANLDSASAQRIMELIRKLNRETGVTFVFSTHDPRVVKHVHRSVWLNDGRIQQAEEV